MVPHGAFKERTQMSCRFMVVDLGGGGGERVLLDFEASNGDCV